MFAKIRSFGLKGIGGYEVSVECFISGGLPHFDIVGLPDAAVKEARDRVRAAIKISGYKFPPSRVTVNLAPADTKTAGTVYDLPVLLGLLSAMGQIKRPDEDCAFFGELSLMGELRPVYGALPMALAARRGKPRTLRSGITNKEREFYKEQLKILDLGLEERMTSKVGLLSGGQRQALTLLMATLQKPKLLLLDEHTAALDPKTASKVLEATEKIVSKDNLTTMMITHNMRDAIQYGNRLIMMYDGHIVVDVSGEEKKNLTVEQLLNLFSQASGSDEVDDKLVLG